MSKSNFLEAQALTCFLQGNFFQGPVLYLALFTIMPDEDNNGYAEVSDVNTGYFRQLIQFNSISSEGGGPSDGTFALNTNTPTYGPRTVDDWGTLVGWGLYDNQALNTGSLYYYGTFFAPFTVDVGKVVAFPVDAIRIFER